MSDNQPSVDKGEHTSSDDHQLSSSIRDLADGKRSSKRRKLDANALVLRPNEMANTVLALDKGHEFYDYVRGMTEVFVAQGTDSNEHKRKVFESQAMIDKCTVQLQETEAALGATKDTVVAITNENRLLKEDISKNKVIADECNRQRAEQVHNMVSDLEKRVQAATDSMQSKATKLSEAYHNDMVQLMAEATTNIQAMHVDISAKFSDFAREIAKD